MFLAVGGLSPSLLLRTTSVVCLFTQPLVLFQRQNLEVTLKENYSMHWPIDHNNKMGQNIVLLRRLEHDIFGCF